MGSGALIGLKARSGFGFGFGFTCFDPASKPDLGLADKQRRRVRRRGRQRGVRSEISNSGFTSFDPAQNSRDLVLPGFTENDRAGSSNEAGRETRPTTCGSI